MTDTQQGITLSQNTWWSQKEIIQKIRLLATMLWLESHDLWKSYSHFKDGQISVDHILLSLLQAKMTRSLAMCRVWSCRITVIIIWDIADEMGTSIGLVCSTFSEGFDLVESVYNVCVIAINNEAEGILEVSQDMLDCTTMTPTKCTQWIYRAGYPENKLQPSKLVQNIHHFWGKKIKQCCMQKCQHWLFCYSRGVVNHENTP